MSFFMSSSYEKLKKEAEQGNAEAQSILGYCYKKGYGIKKNMEQVVYWLQKSAEQGDAEAQLNLSVCYATGKGVEENMEQAVYWV